MYVRVQSNESRDRKSGNGQAFIPDVEKPIITGISSKRSNNATNNHTRNFGRQHHRRRPILYISRGFL